GGGGAARGRGAPRRARALRDALEAHEPARFRLAEAGPELGACLRVETRNGLRRVQSRHVAQALEPAPPLRRGIEQAQEDRGEVRDVRDAVTVDEANGLLGVEAPHEDARTP